MLVHEGVKNPGEFREPLHSNDDQLLRLGMLCLWREKNANALLQEKQSIQTPAV